MNVKLSRDHMNAVKWLLKAVSPDKYRETLQMVHITAPGKWEATDGFRLHILTLKPNAETIIKAGDSMGREGYQTIMALEPGLYTMKVDGNFLVFEKDLSEKLNFPDTSVITGLNRPLGRSDTEIPVCHVSLDPVLMGDTLFGIKDVKRAHVEIGQVIHVEAENEVANYFAVVMPMFAQIDGLPNGYPQIGPALWKFGMTEPEPKEETPQGEV